MFPLRHSTPSPSLPCVSLMMACPVLTYFHYTPAFLSSSCSRSPLVSVSAPSPPLCAHLPPSHALNGHTCHSHSSTKPSPVLPNATHYFVPSLLGAASLSVPPASLTPLPQLPSQLFLSLRRLFMHPQLTPARLHFSMVKTVNVYTENCGRMWRFALY